MRKKGIWYFLGIALLLGVVTASYLLSNKKTPTEDISRARKSLAEAETIYASKYSPELYRSASKFYDSAMIVWKSENSRFILFRDYKNVNELANQSELLSVRAIAETKDIISDAERNLGLQILKIKDLFLEFDLKYNNFPFDGKLRDDLVKSKLLFKEGTLAFEQANYLLSEVKLDSAEELITFLQETYNEKLEDYFAQFPQWKKLVDQSIAHSKRNNSSCIIVDKIARECMLYKNGKMIQNWDAELGSNWLGDKNRQGDKATPEGLYKVVSKKSNGNSSYHKALLLNYPNEDDQKRFLANKKSGLLDQNAKIGNMIEIHGNGGNGIDWTDGCVALSDSDMDKLFAACPVGTAVIIVGSVKPLNELYFNEL